MTSAPARTAPADRIALSMRDVVAMVGLARSTINKLRSMGKFPPGRRIGGKLLWSPQDIRDWFQAWPKEPQP